MRVHSDSFKVQKAGNQESEYEDARWPRQSIRQTHLNAKCFRFAVADGATETSFSALWAKLLVRAYGNGRIESPSILDSLVGYQTYWHHKIDSKQLPWYAEQKVTDGAFSSLLGITLFDPPDRQPSGAWRALAVGDSCLVQMKGEQPLVFFPLKESSQFNSRPFLLSSNQSRNTNFSEGNGVLQLEGWWEEGDTFYLMTDAIACWFMKVYESGANPWNDFWDFEDQTQFAAWVKSCRDAGSMKNDDVTLVRFTPYW